MTFLQIIKKSIWFGLIPKLTTLINVLLLPLITPYLTAEDMGVWGILQSYAGLFLSVYTMGLHMHLNNSYYEYGHRYPHFWRYVLYWLYIFAFIFALLLFIIIYTTFYELTFERRLILSCSIAICIVVNPNIIVAQHLYTLKGTPKPLVLRVLCGGLVGLLVTFVVVRILQLGYWGFVIGYMINNMLTSFMFISPIWYRENIMPRLQNSLYRIYFLLKISLPVVPHALGFMLLSSSSRIIMSWYNIPLDFIGVYSNGYVLGDYITIITTALATALTPQMQESYRSKNFHSYRFLYILCQGLALCSITLFSLWMPSLYAILIRNAELSSGIIISQYASFANCIYPLYVFMSTVCFIEKRTKSLLWLVFVPGMINCLLLIIGIPLFGYKIAIYSTLISYWSQLIIPFFVKYYRVQIMEWLGPLYKLILLSFVSIVLLASSIYLSGMNYTVKIFVSICILLPVLMSQSYIKNALKQIKS